MLARIRRTLLLKVRLGAEISFVVRNYQPLFSKGVSKMKLDSEIKLRITSDEKKLIKDMSERYRVSMSEMIRKQIFADMEKLDRRSTMTDEQYFGIVSEISKLTESVGRVETELHKIGININQIAKYYNSKNDTSSVSALNDYLRLLDVVSEKILDMSESVRKDIFE